MQKTAYELRISDWSSDVCSSDLIDSFFEANIGLTDDIPKFNLFDKNTIFTRGRMLPPSKVSGTTLDKVVLADGCIVAAERIEQSVIGVRSRIGAGTVIKTTYMMGCDFYQTLDEIDQAHEEGIHLAGVGENCYIEKDRKSTRLNSSH